MFKVINTWKETTLFVEPRAVFWTLVQGRFSNSSHNQEKQWNRITTDNLHEITLRITSAFPEFKKKISFGSYQIPGEDYYLQGLQCTLKFYHHKTYRAICMYGSTLIIHMKVNAVRKKNCVAKPREIKNIIVHPV